MAAPPDQEAVTGAVRIGWAMSELRGRNRLSGTPTESRVAAQWPSHALPLNEERSNAELEIETERLLTDLAPKLAVDPISPIQPDPPVTPPATCSAFVTAVTKQLFELSTRTPSSGNDLDRSKKWDQLAEVLYRWDADIQDHFAINSVRQLAGYNLGRALADVYWALDPQAADEVTTSWNFLLGPERRTRINEYLRRLSAYFDPLSPSAISGSLSTWGSVAVTVQWREQADSLAQLHEQLRRWYSLVVLGQSPLNYLRPFGLIRNWRITRSALRAFLPELSISFAALGGAAAFGTLISIGYGAAWVKSLLGFLSVFGISSAAITARVKTVTKDLASRLKSKAYADAASIDFTCTPVQKPTSSPLPNSNRRSAARAIRRTSVQRNMDPVLGQE
jgi:hypothetical protein